MKTCFFRSLRVGVLLGAISGQALFVIAADETVTGNLTVEGDLDMEGDALSMGTRGDSSVAPGLTLLYADDTAPSIYFSASRGAANWLWQDEAGKIQMKLGSDNKFTLFNQATTPQPGIVLDPLGVTSFSGPVQFSSSASFSGVVSVPGVTFGGGGALSVQSLYVAKGLTIGSSDSAMNLGNQNSVVSDNMGGIAVGVGNTVGGSSSYQWEWQTAELEGVLGAEYVLIVPGNHVATITQYKSAGIYETNTGYLYINGGYSAAGFYGYGIPDITATYDGTNTYINLGGYEGTPTWEADALGVLSLGWDIRRRASQASAFGISNIVQSERAFAFGMGNVINADDSNSYDVNTSSVIPLKGSAAYGFNNVITVDNAYVLGRGITNSSIDSVQIGMADNAKIIIDGNGRLGVGNVEPSEKLDVSGNARVSGTITAAKLRIPESGDLSMGDFTAGGDPSAEE